MSWKSVAKGYVDSEVVWRPEEHAWTDDSRLKRFLHQHKLNNLDELIKKAVLDPAWYWDAVVRDLDLYWQQPYSKVMDQSRGKAWTEWFVDGKLNISENCLDRHVRKGKGDRVAIVWEGEDGEERKYTYAEMLTETNKLANALIEMGVGKGDRIGIFMPMIPETAMALLAVSRIGAILIPIFSGYGAQAVATRLSDAEAKVLITADGFFRRGKVVPMKETADEAIGMAPTIQKQIVVQRLHRDISMVKERDVFWIDLLSGKSDFYEPADTDSNDAFMLIYTSGTTGKPKGAVHVHTGFPVKAANDMAYAFDLCEDDTMFWFTDIGWMMGPWEILGVLILGATMVFYEGTPDFPKPDRLWDLVEKYQVTHLGISPTAVRSLMNQGDNWVLQHDLSSLRVLGSTGEPWNPEPWLWFFKVVGESRCPIINYSGGTEISGGILGCFPLTPQKPGSFTGPFPGVDADVFSEEGHSVTNEVGELVIKQAWVGMTRGFWRDSERYLETYWSRWKDIWVHGDWALVDENGFWYIHGRSDDTLKIAGKRVGPAEVESALVAHEAVIEAAAIGVPDELKGEAVVAFVVLTPGFIPSDQLQEELKEQVVNYLGKALKPKQIHIVKDIPKTRNAKIMRRIVKAAYLGKDPGDTSALENPQAIEGISKPIL